MKLPKLYRPIKIKFWSLRNGLGDGYGVVYDIDTEVERTVRRVLCEREMGWKFQIVNLNQIREWDYFADTDQEILDNYGNEIEFQHTDYRFDN